MTDGYQVRTADEDGVRLAVEWAGEEGWNPGLNDAECYRLADPGGFFVGVLDNEPIATISAIRYDDHFGFIGFYIVHPDHRGKGFGYRLWQHAMTYLEGCNVGLDGVIDQQDSYRKSGFKLAYSNIRFQGRAGQHEASFTGSVDIVPLSKLPFDALLRYEADFFPADRSEFLQAWVRQPDALALASMGDGALAGYGVRRSCDQGYKIGPLFADSPGVAADLLDELVRDLDPGATFYLDVPEPNATGLELATSHGMEPVFNTARMYTGDDPTLPLRRVFGVTSFEVG